MTTGIDSSGGQSTWSCNNLSLLDMRYADTHAWCRSFMNEPKRDCLTRVNDESLCTTSIKESINKYYNSSF